jgi:hypothetical protein
MFRKVESGLLSDWNNLESGDRGLGAGRGSRTTREDPVLLQASPGLERFWIESGRAWHRGHPRHVDMAVFAAVPLEWAIRLSNGEGVDQSPRRSVVLAARLP